MMNLSEFLRSPSRRDQAATPEMNALVDRDALREADLVDVRFDGGCLSVALLLDLRTSLQFRLANTAALILNGVEEMHWSSREPRGPRWVAHYVMSSRLDVDTNRLSLELVCLGGWRLNAVASAAEFIVGNVSGLPETQPDFAEDDDETIAAAMPGWDSAFEPRGATFVGMMTARDP
jgi:hypothetical protein